MVNWEDMTKGEYLAMFGFEIVHSPELFAFNACKLTRSGAIIGINGAGEAVLWDGGRLRQLCPEGHLSLAIVAANFEANNHGGWAVPIQGAQ